jgi:hypothetical protein
MDKGKTKIVCVGNMNNTMFALIRHLKYRGYKADLILLGDEDHFQPESDTFEIEKYISQIKKVDWLEKDIVSFNSKEVKRVLDQYDYIICAGVAMAYLNYSGIIVDMFIPFGSDLYQVPFDLGLTSKSKYIRAMSKTMAVNQTQAIKKSRKVFWDVTNSEFDKVVQQFNINKKLISNSSPFIYTNEFNIENVKKNYSKSGSIKVIDELKLKYDCLVFNHIRQCWIDPPDRFSYKGNDKIFKGFARFLKNNPKNNPLLIVFEYGQNVEDSKVLIRELGIENNVHWFQKTTRKEILCMISKIDIGIGEIGDDSWFSYGAIFEFLAMEKPVIHHREDSLYLNLVPSLYPMFSAKNEEDIYLHLNSFYTNKDHFTEVGSQAHKWYIENSINRSLNIIEKEISLSSSINYKILKKIDSILISITPGRFFKKLNLFLSLKLKAGPSVI